jgi:Na+/proline symporter
LDVYINGVITKSTELIGVPKQNYGDVYVAMNGGFSGYISNLWYYNYALGTTAIQNIVQRGPNTKMADASATALAKKDTNYLSLRWYFYGNNDQYNP